MPSIEYVPKNFAQQTEGIIRVARSVCEDYASQGYDLTLRQLYYQFVARDLLPNTEQSYNRLGSIVSDARLAGMLDWSYIVDRTRSVKSLAHWENPAELVETAAEQFRLDRWDDQPERVEVWIEKEALAGVLQSACPALDVPYFSCKGYASSSALWRAAQRLREHVEAGQRVTVIHLGDHDPSGIDMTRDIRERLAMFMAVDLGRTDPGDDAETHGYEMADDFTVERIALNMDQIEEHKPPPNPAKLSDSRAMDYIARFGRSSWELDALDPATLSSLIENAVLAHRDEERWDARTEREETEREALTLAAANWHDVSVHVRDEYGPLDEGG